MSVMTTENDHWFIQLLDKVKPIKTEGQLASVSDPLPGSLVTRLPYPPPCNVPTKDKDQAYEEV